MRTSLFFSLALMVGTAFTARVGNAQSAPWELPLLSAVAPEKLVTTGVTTLDPSGDPERGPAIVFDDPNNLTGSVRIPLDDIDVDLNSFDQIRFDLLMEGGVCEPRFTLWGVPDATRCRNFYFKRMPKIGEWESVHYALALDDDGRDKKTKPPARCLIIRFGKHRDLMPGTYPKVRIANLRLVRSPLTATLDPQEVTFSDDESGVTMRHPVQLANHSDRALTVTVGVASETLQAFQAAASRPTFTLAAGAKEVVDVSLTVGRKAADALAAGHGERGLVEVRAKELPGFIATPLRGYRPVYVYGVIPPRQQPEIDPPTLPKAWRALDSWSFEAPDMVPGYSDHFRCAKPEGGCGFRLSARNIRTYYCHNDQCQKHEKSFNVEQSSRLFRAYLGLYHTHNAVLAREHATAFVKRRDAAHAAMATRILLEYANRLPTMPIVSSNSTGFLSKLTHAVLSEKGPLLELCAAYQLLRGAGALDAQQQALIEGQLLVPTLSRLNTHFYGTSSGQVGMTSAVIQAALIVRRPWFLADALVGDCGVEQMLARTFDGDGIGVEGGAYAKRAAKRMTDLADFLDRCGIATHRGRLAAIRSNTSAVFDFARPDVDMTLQQTGYSILVSGAGPERRKVSVNWASSRDRGEADLLAFHFGSQHGKMVNELGRIAYGNEHCHLMYTSMAHNGVVVDEKDVAMNRMRPFVHQSDARSSSVLMVSEPASPLYTGVKTARYLLLWDGLLLVVDSAQADDVRQFDRPFYGQGKLTLPAGGWQPMAALGRSKPYQTPKALQSQAVKQGFRATWRSAGNHPQVLTVYCAADEATLIKGKIPSGWTAEWRDFAMLRTQGRTQNIAAAYEITNGDTAGHLASVRRLSLPRNDGWAAAYEVQRNDGSKLTVLLSFDGASYELGACKVNDTERIAVGFNP